MTKSKRRDGEFRSRQDNARSKSAEGSECQTCGATLAADARFCHRCGTPLPDTPARTPSSAKRSSILVYSVAAVSIIGATLAAIAFTYSDRVQPVSPAMERGGGQRASSIDLSTMTPREAADRLFNRVMSASERGDADEVARFAPMAVAAYARVSSLDLDARYHLGLLSLQLDDLDQVREQIAIMKQSAPRHLLALVLEHDVASRAGDLAAANRAAAEFKAAFNDELAQTRPEYEAHRSAIDRFRDARAAAESESVAAAQPVAKVGGAAIFESKCAKCHGPEAQGTDQGPPLVHKIYEPGHHADVAFYLAVRRGVPAHHWPFGNMPPIEGVSDEDIEQIVAYVRGLQRAAGIQ